MNKIKLLIFILLPVAIHLFSCTGTNIRSSLYGLASTTHPVQKYEKFYAGSGYRGGLIYYHDIVGGVKSTEMKAQKEVSGCSASYLMLISLGDSSIMKAKESAKITRINSIKHEISAVLAGLIWHEHCTIITGE
jgi:hypothetical protein